MKAFFLANNHAQIFDSVSTPGHRVVGELDLPPGKYVVFAKADVGTNVATGYPPPPWPYGGGALTLTYGGASDQAYIGVKPESAENIENAALIVAAQGRGRARLTFIATSQLRTVVNSARLVALQLDGLSIVQVGPSGLESDSDVAEEQSSLLLQFGMFTGMHAHVLEAIQEDDS
jgi:hypothetical protein